MLIPKVTHDEVISDLDYDPDSGLFKWKKRSLSRFKDERSYKIWNSKLSGKNAGTLLGNGYRMISIGKDRIYAHRLAWFYVHKEWPDGEIDHVNQCRVDNRISNLRVVTTRGNARNRRRRESNLSGINGVSWSKSSKKWWAFISTIHLGYFSDFFEACCSRKSAEILHGYHENHGR